jgi:opacity protein-like surface antigen
VVRFCMFSGAAMKRLATAIATIALIGTPGFAADMAVKAPPSAPAPVPTWTGFYGGIQFGGGWGDEAVNYSPNDPFAVALFNGIAGVQGAASVIESRRMAQWAELRSVTTGNGRTGCWD